MRIAEKLKEKRKTLYQEVGEKFGVSARYVGQIARAERIPRRNTGKAMKVLRELEKMCSIDNKRNYAND